MRDIELGIREIQRYIDKNISNINRGGCIHFSYYLSRKLNQLNIKNFVVLCDSVYDNVRPLGYDDFEPVSHVMVYIPEIGYIDGKTIVKRPSYRHYYERTKLDPNKLRRHHSWNPMYYRRQNSTLSKIINKYLPDDYRRE